jgi:hypothetical protein
VEDFGGAREGDGTPAVGEGVVALVLLSWTTVDRVDVPELLRPCTMMTIVSVAASYGTINFR